MVVILAITPLTSERSFDPDFILHSWAGLALVPLAAVHLAGNTAWLSRLRQQRLHAGERTFSLVNVAIVGSLGVCIVSGFPLWLEWVDNAANEESIYESIHAISGFLGVGLTIAQLITNRRRIVQLARRTKVAANGERALQSATPVSPDGPVGRRGRGTDAGPTWPTPSSVPARSSCDVRA